MNSEYSKPPKNEQFGEILDQFIKNKGSMIQNDHDPNERAAADDPDTNTRTQNFLNHLKKPTKGGRKKSLRKTNRKRKTRRRRTNRRR
jgi:hypothetical protein